MYQKLMFALLALGASQAFGATYKCVVDGKATYQDRPCQGGAAGGQINVQPNTPALSTTDQTPSGADRTKAWLDKLEAERTRDALDRDISKAEDNREQMQKQMDAELTTLKIKKLNAQNNLAGATWEQSISTEMQAVSLKYDTQLRALDSRITDLKTKRAKYD
ncbi:MAG: DUF4124 domain-containing protein [Solimonas sp.]